MPADFEMLYVGNKDLFNPKKNLFTRLVYITDVDTSVPNCLRQTKKRFSVSVGRVSSSQWFSSVVPSIELCFSNLFSGFDLAAFAALHHRVTTLAKFNYYGYWCVRLSYFYLLDCCVYYPKSAPFKRVDLLFRHLR